MISNVEGNPVSPVGNQTSQSTAVFFATSNRRPNGGHGRHSRRRPAAVARRLAAPRRRGRQISREWITVVEQGPGTLPAEASSTITRWPKGAFNCSKQRVPQCQWLDCFVRLGVVQVWHCWQEPAPIAHRDGYKTARARVFHLVLA